MTLADSAGVEADAPATGRTDPAPPTRDESRPSRRRFIEVFRFSNVGVIYVIAALVVTFSLLEPETFPTMQTLRFILNQNAIAGIVALSLVVPLSARMFDLSIGAAMGLSNVFVASLLVKYGFPPAVAVAITVVSGLLVGIINGVIVVRWKIDSFIGTLASGAILTSGISYISDERIISGKELSSGFSKLVTANVGGIAAPVFVMLAVAFIVWVLLKHTLTGRRIYATGFNEEAARLAGIRTARIQFGSLLVSGFTASLAGVILASQVSAGVPNVGPPYLLEAFAAAFLGATQFGGYFNPWGTVVAVLLVGTGKTGLSLSGSPVWLQNMFSGVVLLTALLLVNVERSVERRRLLATAKPTD